jgi:hypothetical protein
MMIGLTRRDDVVPLCPHCAADIVEVWYKELSGMLGKRFLYFCPACRKVLGISHRKGFWMG